MTQKKKSSAGKKPSPKADAGSPAKPKRRSAAPKAAAAKPRAVRSRKPAATTSIIARYDVGFGNQLFIRGEGPGLSWDRGIPMECRGADEWRWSSAAATQPFPFKLLINDHHWSEAENAVAEPGKTTEISPVF